MLKSINYTHYVLCISGEFLISHLKLRKFGTSCIPERRRHKDKRVSVRVMQPFGSLGHFSCEQPSVAKGILQGLLQALQLVTGILEGRREGNVNNFYYE